MAVLTAAVLIWLGLLYLLGQAAAVVASRHLLHVSVWDMLPVSLELPAHWSDPALAWPPDVQAQLPGPVGFYGVSAAVLLVLLLAVAGALALAGELRADNGWRESGSGKNRRPSAAWAGRKDVRELHHDGSTRLVLGYTTGWRRQLLAAEARHSVIVFGPTQMGKTVGVVIPAILEWKGPVMATSVKPDVIQMTRRHRESRGEVWVFDPTAALGRPGHTWSPLASSRAWQDARAMGSWLAAASAGSQQRDAVSSFFDTLASKLIAPLLFAAANSGRTMRHVLSWANTGNEQEPARLLEQIGDREACEAFEAHCRREERLKGNVTATVETLLDVYGDPAVAKSAETSEIDPTTLLAGDASLFLLAPDHEQERLRPLFVALTQSVLRTAVEQAATWPAGRLPYPFLVCLDEAAHVAPLHNLAKLANTVSAANIQLVSIWHDMAQISALFGPAAASVVNGHRAKLLLPGLSDPATLEHVSRLIGQTEYVHQSVSRGRHGGDGGTTEAPEYRELAPVELLRQLPRGQAVCVYGNRPPVRLRLRPWFEDRVLKARANGGQH